MNKILKIALFFLLLVSCTTPEQKIENSFNEQRFARRNSHVVQNVIIYDTIYFKDIIDSLNTIESKLQDFDKIFIVRNTDNIRDSLRKTNHLPRVRDSLLRKSINNIQSNERAYQHLRHMATYRYALMRIPAIDSISGYYVKMITNRDTLNFIVTNKFDILCPVFMYQ